MCISYQLEIFNRSSLISTYNTEIEFCSEEEKKLWQAEFLQIPSLSYTTDHTGSMVVYLFYTVSLQCLVK